MATKTFHEVLNVIQFSGLNYKMEISPFSATIHMKNSAVTDKNGNQLHKPQENRIHVSQIKGKKLDMPETSLTLKLKLRVLLVTVIKCTKLTLILKML